MKKASTFLLTFLAPLVVYANTNALDMMNGGFNTIQNTLNNIDKRKEEEKKRQHELEMQRRQIAHEQEINRQREQAKLAAKKQAQSNQSNQSSQQQTKILFWDSNGWVQTKSSNDQLFALIHRDPIKQVVFVFGDNSCIEHSVQVVPAFPMYMNDQLVNFSSSCSRKGQKMYWGTTEEDKNIIVNQFKKSTNVVLDSHNKVSAAVFSAQGFSKQWKR